MSSLLYWTGCRGLGAVYCALIAAASFASLAYAAGFTLGSAIAPLFASTVIALTSTGSGLAAAAWLVLTTIFFLGHMTGVLPEYAGLAVVGTAILWGAASRRYEIVYAGLAAGSLGDPTIAAAAITASGAAAAASTRRLHAGLTVLSLAPITYYATPTAAAMVTASLAFALVVASGGPARLKSCPVRTDAMLEVPALIVAGAGILLEAAGIGYWASLIWPTGFILQASSILVPEPALGNLSLSSEAQERLREGS